MYPLRLLIEGVCGLPDLTKRKCPPPGAYRVMTTAAQRMMFERLTPILKLSP